MYREINFSRGKRLYIEWCSRKERSGTAWLPAGVWQLKGVTTNAFKEGARYVKVKRILYTFYYIVWRLEIVE